MLFMKKVILYLAMSLDGFIARKDGGVDWLDEFNKGKEDYGYKKFYGSVESVVLGRTTFDQFPNSYPEKDCYLFSHKDSGYDNVKTVSGEPEKVLKGIQKDFPVKGCATGYSVLTPSISAAIRCMPSTRGERPRNHLMSK